jgi:hypothetical protein
MDGLAHKQTDGQILTDTEIQTAAPKSSFLQKQMFRS